MPSPESVPGAQSYQIPPLPPVAAADRLPSHAPQADGLTDDEIDTVTAGVELTVATADDEQPQAEVTVTV